MELYLFGKHALVASAAIAIAVVGCAKDFDSLFTDAGSPAADEGGATCGASGSCLCGTGAGGSCDCRSTPASCASRCTKGPCDALCYLSSGCALSCAQGVSCSLTCPAAAAADCALTCEGGGQALSCGDTPGKFACNPPPGMCDR